MLRYQAMITIDNGILGVPTDAEYESVLKTAYEHAG
jgi:hypothetical protein